MAENICPAPVNKHCGVFFCDVIGKWVGRSCKLTRMIDAKFDRCIYCSAYANVSNRFKPGSHSAVGRVVNGILIVL